MTDDNWKTLRVPKDAYDKAKAQKEEHERTWGDQLVCSETTTTNVVPSDEIVEQLSQQLDEIEPIQAETVKELEAKVSETASVVEELSRNGDSVDESEIARMVVADLKSELPTAIAEELR